MPAVTKRRRNLDSPARPLLAAVVATGLLVVVTFQAALVWFLGALVVLARGGRSLVPVPEAIARPFTRVT